MYLDGSVVEHVRAHLTASSGMRVEFHLGRYRSRYPLAAIPLHLNALDWTSLQLNLCTEFYGTIVAFLKLIFNLNINSWIIDWGQKKKLKQVYLKAPLEHIWKKTVRLPKILFFLMLTISQFNHIYKKTKIFS